MIAEPRVVVVVHEGDRTGPPVFALDLVRWLQANASFDLNVLLLRSGPLEADFAAVAPVTVLDDLDEGRGLLDAADLVYVNTAASIEALARTGARPRRVLSHVHELDVALRHYLAAEHLDLLLSVTDRFLVGPDIARDNLVRGHGVAADAVRQVPYFRPPRPVPDPAERRRARAELGVGDDTVVVGGCGTRDWRKAPDLLAQVAWHLRDRDGPPVHFVWLGDPIPSIDHWDAAADLDLLGLDGRFTLLGSRPDPLSAMSAYDVFALTSRQDTFPLVVLEASTLGLPVVCFDTSGTPELLAACGGGTTVPYPDLRAFADAVWALATDPDGRRARGERLRAHVAEHHTLDGTGVAVTAELHALLAEPGHRR